MRVARPVRRAGRGDGPVERPAPRLGPTPTPSTRRGKARFTAPSSSTSSAGGSSAGRSIRCRPPPWSPTPWACAQAWRSSSANPTGPLSTRTVHPVHLVGVHPARARLRPHALHGLGRGLPVTTMPSSSRSGAGCRSSSSTVGNGGRASSSPTRSSSTSRSSTIASVVTRRLACLPRSSSRLGTSQRQSHESSLATPRNSGQPTVPEAATQSAAGAVGS
jgi:hypothetical protein